MEDARQQFQARIECLTEALDYAEQWSREHRLPAELRAKLLLIIEELFTNAALHGDAAALGDTVSLRLLQEDATLIVQFEASGTAYDPFANLRHEAMNQPLAERPVGGLGVILVQALSSRVGYRRVDDRNQIHIWLPCHA